MPFSPPTGPGDTNGAPPADRLDGWKEIAAYFRRGVRTVQRWEQELGMPVHRMRTGRGETVHAHVGELEEWRAGAEGRDAERQADAPRADGNHPDQPAASAVTSSAGSASEAQARADLPDPRAASGDSQAAARPGGLSRRVLIALGVAALVVALAAVWTGWRIRTGDPVPPDAAAVSRQPFSGRVAGGLFSVYDSDNRLLWQKTAGDLGVPLADEAYENVRRVWDDPVRVSDLDGDGLVEVLLVTEPYRPASRGLFCFNHDGTERFRHAPERIVRFGEKTYAPPRRGALVWVTGTPGQPQDIWFASADTYDFPTVLEKLDRSGNVTGEYWSNGQISTLVTGEVAGRPLVFVGAISNEFHAASLAVLDAARASGSAPAARDYYRCHGCPPGDPLAFLVFPRLAVTEAIDAYSWVANVSIDALGQIKIGVYHDVGTAVPPELVGSSASQYRLDSDFRVIAADLGAHYSAVHRWFERRELLDRPFDHARDSGYLWPVLRWTGQGFVEIK